MKKIWSFGPIFIIAAALLWSFDGVLRIGLYSLPPAVIVFYEHLLGALVMLLFAFKWVKELKKMRRKEWVAIMVVALFSGALGTILYTSALQYVQYSQYSVVVLLQQQLQPIWAIAAAAVLLKEKVTRKFLLYAVLALVGAYFITFKDLYVNLATGAGTAAAGLLALGAGFLWGSSTAISKIVLNRVSFLAATALRFFLAPIFALAFIFAGHQSDMIFKITPAQWQILLIITFSTGLLALAIYYYGLKRTPARIATLCELVWPASAILIDYFLYQKTLSATQIFGIVLLLFAIYHVTKPLQEKSLIK